MVFLVIIVTPYFRLFPRAPTFYRTGGSRDPFYVLLFTAPLPLPAIRKRLSVTGAQDRQYHHSFLVHLAFSILTTTRHYFPHHTSYIDDRSVFTFTTLLFVLCVMLRRYAHSGYLAQPGPLPTEYPDALKESWTC